MQKQFYSTKEERKRDLNEELRYLKKRLKTADKQQAKTINTVLQHYKHTQRKTAIYITAAVLAFLFQ